MNNDGAVSHLKELRRHIIWVLCGIGLVFVLLMPWMEISYGLLTYNLQITQSFYLVALKPLSPTMAMLQSNLLISLLVNFPHIIYRIWKFIKPSLYKQEKKTARFFIVLSSILFYGGVLFSYFVSTPFLIQFNQWILPQDIVFSLDIGHYINFLMTSVFTFGIFFLLPIFILFLTKYEITSVKSLKKFRKYFIIICFFIAMLITPPDIFSQAILALPLCLLYEAGIFLSKKLK